VTDHELAELVGRVGNLYMRKRLSPPFHIRAAVRRWVGLSQDEIIAVIEKHFADCRHFYTSGSGDAHFGMVEAAIRKAMELKHSTRDQAADEPVRPRRKRGVRKVHNASGFPDVIVDREDGDAVGEDEGADA
jgi:hypothetical protein